MTKKKNIVILLGAPGSGKGTQSAKLIEHYGFSTITMGDLVRQEIKTESPLGKEMTQYLNNGDLVPNDIINKIFVNSFNNHKIENGLVLDGFPRTLEQCKLVKSLVDINQYKLTIILIDVNDNLLENRLLERGRSDDSIEVIKNRLINYNNQMQDIKVYFKSDLNYVNGNQEIDNVFNEIILLLN